MYAIRSYYVEQLGRLLEEQAAGDFRRRVPERGIGGSLRMARRLNDHASDLADRFRLLPERVRLRLAATDAWRIATGSSIAEATGLSVAICFDKGNINEVAISLRKKYP